MQHFVIRLLNMVYELIVFGGFAFWLLTAIVFLIALSMVESLEEFSGASALQCGYIVFLVLFCNISLDLSPYWWSPVPYLLIGLLWFLFMMTHRVKSLRRWIDKQPNPDEIRKNLKDGSGYSVATEWRHIYNTEPSWPKFFDRVLLWPLSMVKFASRDMLKAVYDVCVDRLVAYKHALLGIKS
jgi:hypothetical protein